MDWAAHGIIAIIVIGIIAGWLAGLVVSGTGFGLIGDLIIGIIGAFIGNWLLLSVLHISLGTGWIAAIISSAIGAIVLLLVIKLIRGGMGR
ncbi:MAG TPA: GlsB/YeaQ/YmgE family stress response membrane protein [Stellaceae bacterium]|nr:GlsB/YeaQ/YmgE family stress response membrane protein [Stellaceae bacterium]